MSLPEIKRQLEMEYQNASFNTLMCLHDKFERKLDVNDSLRFQVIKRMLMNKYFDDFHARTKKPWIKEITFNGVSKEDLAGYVVWMVKRGFHPEIHVEENDWEYQLYLEERRR